MYDGCKPPVKYPPSCRGKVQPGSLAGGRCTLQSSQRSNVPRCFPHYNTKVPIYIHISTLIDLSKLSPSFTTALSKLVLGILLANHQSCMCLPFFVRPPVHSQLKLRLSFHSAVLVTTSTVVWQQVHIHTHSTFSTVPDLVVRVAFLFSRFFFFFYIPYLVPTLSLYE